MNKFLFGVATSSHQNEGNNYLNNWWHWEVKQNLEKSGVACNSWVDYREDIKCVKKLECNAYRFSMEWSRIFVEEGKVDNDALARYEDMVDCCLKNEIEPIITLHHFTRPMWFDRKYGGLHNSIVISKFCDYVEVVCKKFGGKVKWWITFNEPMLECVNGYLRGARPPGFKGDFNNMYHAIENIIESHRFAYDIIKKYNSESMVSIAKNLVDFEKQYNYDPVKSRIEDQVIYNFNWGILDAFYKGDFHYGINLAGVGMKRTKINKEWIGKLDFLGINHYNVGYIVIKYSPSNPVDVLLTKKDNHYKKNALSWDINPISMRMVIDMVTQRYGDIPIMVTESGGCEKTESRTRVNVHNHILENHLSSVLEYRKQHKNILGYMWWTLVDNFEWDDGWYPRFGLYKMCRDGIKFERKIKRSGKKYREIIRNFNKK